MLLQTPSSVKTAGEDFAYREYWIFHSSVFYLKYPGFSQKKIGIFAVSTFNTDYILVKEKDFEWALDVLRRGGYVVV